MSRDERIALNLSPFRCHYQSKRRHDSKSLPDRFGIYLYTRREFDVGAVEYCQKSLREFKLYSAIMN